MPRGSGRVLIIEDHALFAESLELALSVEGYDVRRAAVTEPGSSPGSVLAAALRQRPTTALLDLDLGRLGDGVTLIRPLAGAGVNVVVLTAALDQARWGETLAHGARAVIAKTRPLNEILSTIRRLHQGLPVLPRSEREELVAHWTRHRSRTRDEGTRLRGLTPREADVLGRLMKGQTVREIAVACVVSEATVRTQVKAILAKLQVSSQVAAVGLAHRVGWRPPQES